MFIVVLTHDDKPFPSDSSYSRRFAGIDLEFAPTSISDSSSLIRQASGLFVTGDTLEIPTAEWNTRAQEWFSEALALDMPILATGQGLFPLNLVFGGKDPKPLDKDGAHSTFEDEKTNSHTIYVSPGSKSAAILGMGGFFKVNSNHSYGFSEAQRSHRLLASAYSVTDGIIEGLESTEHRWVIGFQANVEREQEVHRAFQNIFLGFRERAESFSPFSV